MQLHLHFSRLLLFEEIKYPTIRKYKETQTPQRLLKDVFLKNLQSTKSNLVLYAAVMYFMLSPLTSQVFAATGGKC